MNSRIKNLFHLLLVLTMAVSSLAARASGSLPEVSPEGLKLVKHTKTSAVYMKDGADFSDYDKVGMLECFVAFRKDWQRDQNEDRPFAVNDHDVTRIRSELAVEFNKVFVKELTAKGETVVTVTGKDVLLLRPAIVNLDISAPDTMQPDTAVLSASAGQMTLVLELYDSVTGDLLARVMDAEAAADFGAVMIRDRVTNKADADRILKKWADAVGTYLEHVRSAGSKTQ